MSQTEIRRKTSSMIFPVDQGYKKTARLLLISSQTQTSREKEGHWIKCSITLTLKVSKSIELHILI